MGDRGLVVSVDGHMLIMLQRDWLDGFKVQSSPRRWNGSRPWELPDGSRYSICP